MRAERRIERILISADCSGGIYVYALELSRALARHGIEIVLATVGQKLSDEQRSEAGLIPGLVVEEGSFRSEWMESTREDVTRAGEWLLALEQRWSPDVVHLNSFAHGALPFRAPKVVVGHSCVLSWWRAVHREGAPENWVHYYELVRSGLLGADAVVAPTMWMRQSLEENYGELPNARVVLNGIDFTPVRVPKERFVFAVGRLWDRAKNLSALDRAAESIFWPVYVAGEERATDGSSASYTHIFSLGQLPRPRLLSWLARSSIYASPALYEPFGLSVLEAALNGCALVLGDLPSLRELWAEDAIFVDPEQPRALAQAVGELVEDQPRREALGERARARALRLNARRMAAGYLALYGELLSGERANKKGGFECASYSSITR